MGAISQEVLNAVKNAKEGMGEPTIQPSIMVNKNFDPSDVVEYWSGDFNNSWARQIAEKLADGFTVVRIQTEWSEGLGHVTMIYMVKMK